MIQVSWDVTDTGQVVASVLKDCSAFILTIEQCKKSWKKLSSCRMLQIPPWITDWHMWPIHY